MARPATTVSQCRGFHAELMQRLGTGGHIPYTTWKFLICNGWNDGRGVGMENCRKITETGEALGLWARVRDEGNLRGDYVSVELLAPPVLPGSAPTPSQGPQEAPQLAG